METLSDPLRQQAIPDQALIDALQEVWIQGWSDSPDKKDQTGQIFDLLRARLMEYTDRLKVLNRRVEDQSQHIRLQDRANMVMQESIEELMALQEFAVAIRTVREATTVGRTLLNQISSLVDCSIGDVFVIDENHMSITPMLNTAAELTRVADFQYREGILDWVLKNGKPAIIPNMEQVRNADGTMEKDKLLLIPLIARNRGIGVTLVSMPDSEKISERKLSILSLLNDHAAVAIEQARGYEELLETQRRLETSYHYILRSERLAAVEDLAAGVAHEINNPLQVISSSIELISMINEIPEKSKRFIQMIERESQRISSIVSDLIDFARKDKNGTHIQSININETVKQSLALVRHQFKYADIVTTLEPGQDISPVFAYEKDLQQAFINILTYIRRAMKSGGKLFISTRSGPVWTAVEFRNTGAVIEESLLTRIYQDSPLNMLRDPEGENDMGLSISYNLIKKYQGLMGIENQPEGGAIIVVKLPRRSSHGGDDAQ